MSTQTDTRTAVERRLSRSFRLKIVGKGALVGLFAGALVTLYRLALSHAEQLLRLIISALAQNYVLIALWFGVLILLAFIVSLLVRWEPYTASSGIPQTQADVAGHYNLPWSRIIFAKFIEGTLVAFAGLSMGREGPSVQLGGMAGKGIARFFKTKRGEEHILVTCGAASGMAAAFHAPLTGIMFALEEMQKIFSAPLITAVMAAAVTSDFFVSQILGVKPVLSLHFVSNLPHIDYVIVIIMGIYLGVLGALHNVGMFFAQDVYAKLSYKAPFSRYVIPFVLAGVVAFTMPALLDGGDAIFEILQDPYVEPLKFLAVLLIGKYLLTTLAFGSGVPGGTLFPLVVMGALAGAMFGRVVTELTGTSYAYVANYTALGIAGLFAGVIRAPITGVVLVFELTGSFSSLLSAVLVSIIAYLVADHLNIDAFYEHLFAKMLGRHNRDDYDSRMHASEKLLRSHIVSTESLAAHKLISEIAWPEATLVVSIDRAGTELIPSGNTRIEPFDRLIVVMDEKNETAVQAQLRSICAEDDVLEQSIDT